MKTSRLVLAFITMVIFVISAGGMVIYLTDRPVVIFSSLQAKKNLAAVAIRDSVPLYQQAATRAFALSYLPQYYDKVYYTTQKHYFDKQKIFIQHMQEALENYSEVDIYILAHGGKPFAAWVEKIPARWRKKIRLVYNSGCGSANESEKWLNIGAKTYIAHQGSKSISPIFLFYFLRRFTRGVELAEAYQEANDYCLYRLNQLEEYTGFPSHLPEFDSQAYIFHQ
jgi:hypothetical protein